MATKEYRKKTKKCRGSWKEHGELEVKYSTNSLWQTVVQKKCKRCNAYVSWQLFENPKEFNEWLREKHKNG